VFLSYASEDAEAAQRICESLRAAGVEVWLDQSELRGGDAWDESIRDQIKACALFIPLISANAHARIEGYFRLEWKLAIDRSHRMAPKQPFLVPVVIDDTRQSDDAVPDRFREVQWSRLPGGHVTAAFVERVRRLLLPESSVLSGTPKPSGSDPAPASEKLVRVSSTPKTRSLQPSHCSPLYSPISWSTNSGAPRTQHSPGRHRRVPRYRRPQRGQVRAPSTRRRIPLLSCRS